MKKIDLPKAYVAKDVEDGIYQKWEQSGFFNPDNLPPSHVSPFTISMPPPNATGTLHMGHAVMLAIQDTVIRYQRMSGKKALWLPGTDHAAIATNAKVERLTLEKEGKTRQELGRDEFLKRVRAFVIESQGTIKNQVRKMGSSCDWSRERYTLDEGLSAAVRQAFVQMYDDGLIYRGNRIVNWCPHCMSTLADDEVEYKEEKTPFYYFKYGPVVIGTARPETKFGDKVIIVHPDDGRYTDLVGKEMEVEWILGPIKAKVIADKVADKELGSGAMTITPGHSFVDFDLAQKHGLEVKKIINEEGKLTEEAGEYAGMPVREARRAVVNALQKKGLVEKIDEDYVHNLSVCYRCGTPVEPLPSKQWFVNVNKPIAKLGGKSLKERSLEVVKNGDVKIIPQRFEKIYYNWMENLRDWCISRQIWFGHQIPVWYKEEEIYVGVDSPSGDGWTQDPDTLDTWFSSGLWTFSTLGWPNQTADLKTFHPTSLMETGYDIIFFWVARMILMTTYLMDEVPFKDVYLHGMVRDDQGRKMSKSLDNIIDPLDMIAKYGADATRLSLMVGTTPGNDTNLSEEKVAGYRNFANKLWNISRYIIMSVDEKALTASVKNLPTPRTLSDDWILKEYTNVVGEYNRLLASYQFSAAAEMLYVFTYEKLADWYIEIVKIEKDKEEILVYLLKNLLKLWHPFMPFVTERIWELAGEQETLMIEQLPISQIHVSWYDKWAMLWNGKNKQKITNQFEVVQELITKIRAMRNDSGVSAGKKVAVTLISSEHQRLLQNQTEIIKQLARIEQLEISANGKKPSQSAMGVVAGIEIYLPLSGMIDIDQEIQRLQKEIEQTEKYVAMQKAKLANQQFVSNAPKAVVEAEKTKLVEAENKAVKLKEQLANIK